MDRTSIMSDELPPDPIIKSHRPEHPRKKKEKIDVKTLKLKTLLNIMMERKISEINLKYEIFPSLIANEQKFVELYNTNQLTKQFFDPCIVTPFDHRMMATILVHKCPKEYILNIVPMEEGEQEDPLIIFYQRIYQYSHFDYYKIFLELEINYHRKTIKILRNQYNSILCQKNSAYLAKDQKKKIQQILKKTNKQPTLTQKLNYEKANLSTQERREKIAALRAKVFKEDSLIASEESSQMKKVIDSEQEYSSMSSLSISHELSSSLSSLFQSSSLDFENSLNSVDEISQISSLKNQLSMISSEPYERSEGEQSNSYSFSVLSQADKTKQSQCFSFSPDNFSSFSMEPEQ